MTLKTKDLIHNSSMALVALAFSLSAGAMDGQMKQGSVFTKACQQVVPRKLAEPTTVMTDLGGTEEVFQQHCYEVTTTKTLVTRLQTEDVWESGERGQVNPQILPLPVCEKFDQRWRADKSGQSQSASKELMETEKRTHKQPGEESTTVICEHDNKVYQVTTTVTRSKKCDKWETLETKEIPAKAAVTEQKSVEQSSEQKSTMPAPAMQKQAEFMRKYQSRT